MAQAMQLWLEKDQQQNIIGLAKSAPAFLFRYMDEKVMSEPARTIMYANGTERPTQSMSNILIQLSFVRFSSRLIYYFEN